MIYRKPMKLIIQIEDNLLGQLIYYWTYYEKPCGVLLIGAKTDGLTAVKVDMNNADAGSFVFMLVEKLGARLYNAETKQGVDILDLFM